MGFPWILSDSVRTWIRRWRAGLSRFNAVFAGHGRAARLRLAQGHESSNVIGGRFPGPRSLASTRQVPAHAGVGRDVALSWRAMPVIVRRRSSIDSRPGVPASATFRRRTERMLAFLQMEKCEVSILLTDDSEIRILNRDYRGIDRTTDVLSFSMREGEGARFAGDLLGDVVLSITTAKRQARAAKRPLLDEATMLVAHGLLHLLGWDHATAMDDRRMRRKTDELCVAAGAPPLFALGGVDRLGRSRPASQGEKTASAPPRERGRRTRAARSRG